MGIKVDDRFHAEVLQKHGEHLGTIVAALVENLAVKQTFLTQAATQAERARLLEELAPLHKAFDAEAGLFSGLFADLSG